MRPEHHRVVVALVHRQPRHGPPDRLRLPPRRQQGGLPEARRTSDQAEPQARPVPEPRHKPLPGNHLIAHRRRKQFRRDQDRPPRALLHPLAPRRDAHRGRTLLRCGPARHAGRCQRILGRLACITHALSLPAPCPPGLGHKVPPATRETHHPGRAPPGTVPWRMRPPANLEAGAAHINPFGRCTEAALATRLPDHNGGFVWCVRASRGHRWWLARVCPWAPGECSSRSGTQPAGVTGGASGKGGCDG